MLIPPDPTLSAALPVPTVVNTPYFPLLDESFNLGKVGLRLWPGSKVRQLEVRDMNLQFSEFKYGQLELST